MQARGTARRRGALGNWRPFCPGGAIGCREAVVQPCLSAAGLSNEAGMCGLPRRSDLPPVLRWCARL